MPEKATVVFTHENGKKITVNATEHEDGSVEIKILFGEEGDPGMAKDETGLHAKLFFLLMQSFAGGEVSELEDHNE